MEANFVPLKQQRIDTHLMQDAARALVEISEAAASIVRSIPGSYIHLAWINQDCLENIFSQQRSGVGSSNNPTMEEFLWGTNNLSLRQNRYLSCDYTENWLMTNVPKIKKARKCVYLPFLGDVHIATCAMEVQKLDLEQVLPAFPSRTPMAKAIRLLLDDNSTAASNILVIIFCVI